MLGFTAPVGKQDLRVGCDPQEGSQSLNRQDSDSHTTYGTDALQIACPNPHDHNIITLLNYHPSENFQEQLGCLKQKCLVRDVRVQSRRRQHDDINQVAEVNDEVVLMNRRKV